MIGGAWQRRKRKRRTHTDRDFQGRRGKREEARKKGVWSGGFSSVSAEKVSCLHLPIVWDSGGGGGQKGSRSQDPGNRELGSSELRNSGTRNPGKADVKHRVQTLPMFATPPWRCQPPPPADARIFATAHEKCSTVVEKARNTSCS